MYLLLTDETNVVPNANVRFFAYGGLVVPLQRLPELDDAIAQTRRRYGYAANSPLKFDTNSRPENVSHEAATAAKREIVAACAGTECRFFAYVVLHAIAQAIPRSRAIDWAANTVLGQFHVFLTARRSYGIVAVDRQPNGAEFNHMVEKFTRGLMFDGRQMALERIKLFASTCINASHVSSAVDVALGSFRYCVNDRRSTPASRAMFGALRPMLWDEGGGWADARSRSVLIRPIDVRSPRFRGAYEELIARLDSLAAAPDA